MLEHEKLARKTEDEEYRRWLAKEKRWSVPFECKVKPVLIGWCPCCRNFEPMYFRGSHCWDECITTHNKPYRLIKRVAYPCPGCEGYYLSKEEFRYHEHTFY